MKGFTFSISTNLKWISLFVFFYLPHAQAQVSQPIRYEVEIDNGGKEFHVASDNNNGLILFRTVLSINREFNQWQFINLNESLEKQWEESYLLKSSLYYQQHKIYDSHLYLLFQSMESYDVVIFKLNPKTGNSEYYILRSFIPIDVKMFEISEKAILLGGSYSTRPIVLLFNLELNKSIILPNVYSLKGELNDISLREDHFDVVVSNIFKRNSVIHTYTFNYLGQNLAKEIIFPEEKKSLKDGKLIMIDGQKMIVGTYGRKLSDYSRGVYVALIDVNEITIKYHSYAYMDNFFGYLREKRQARIKKRIERRKEAGKETRFNYRLAIHDLINNNDDQAILLAEAYYPRYKNYSPYYNNSRYSTLNSYNNYPDIGFDGYRYTHAVIVGFDKKGELLWDNSFAIDNVQNYSLQQVVNASLRSDSIFLYYNTNVKINTKIIKGEEVVSKAMPVPISLLHKHEEIKNNSVQKSGGVIQADTNSFFAYGVQKIKNSGSNSRTSRQVFFINKVIYN